MMLHQFNLILSWSKSTHMNQIKLYVGPNWVACLPLEKENACVIDLLHCVPSLWSHLNSGIICL